MDIRGVLTFFCAAPWLGHGRATECSLAMTAMLYGVLFLTVPGTPFDSKATWEIAWLGYGNWLAYPFLAKAILTGSGLVMNIRGIRGASWLRFAGAWLGFLIWTWLASQFALNHSMVTGFPFCIVAALFSLRIMALSLAGLPIPGAPGRL